MLIRVQTLAQFKVSTIVCI